MFSITNGPRVTRRGLLEGMAGMVAMRASGAPAAGMFPALNSVLVHGRVPWPAFANLAATTGFPGVDVSLKEAMQAGADSTNELLQGLHLRPAAINFPVEFRKDDATFEADVAKLAEQARFAAAVNCPRMVTYILSSNDKTPREELRALYQKRFTRCAQILEPHGVRLGLEFLGPLQFRKGKYEFIWRMNDMLAFAKDCGPNVGLLLDAWHWHHAGATTADIEHAGRERIVHVHFDDAPNLPPEQIKDDERLLPGEGVIDLVGFLRALQKIGYRDALSVEVFGRMDKETPEVAARQGLGAAVGVMRKAGIAI